MYGELLRKEAKLAVVGLGYVGLPLALEFANDFSVIGFDVNEKRVRLMKNHIDPSNELHKSAFSNKNISFTHFGRHLIRAKFFVVAVPTPINDKNEPDLSILKSATRTVGQFLKKGDYVIFESTVYPGCTEEVCVPILEELSGLKYGTDFKVGYSPERINPGDKKNTITKIKKIVSGCDEGSLEQIADVYGHVIEAGIHKASTIKVAEAAKVVENTQRDVNIALMNELSVIFEKLDINTFDVLEAAGTKWNFLNFFPGLVGGHCIGVDPYYLIDKARSVGVDPKVISSSREINDDMPYWIAKNIHSKLLGRELEPSQAKVLVKGITFKEDVSDIRNSKVADLVSGLQQFGMQIDVIDPHASPEEVKEEYGIELKTTPDMDYDVVVMAVAHKQFQMFGNEYFKHIAKENAIIVDLKRLLVEKPDFAEYITL
ncbi:MAG: nucleotide sugar dehydrogenase [Bacteroidota bacterium]